ncbi:hypothetical protein, unlikely [Trypanosoma congolense IL3000]|uniref:Uncharacterized protein n=1 Tax=Trypanosoma congolense (strain IL3000) TaxID=1068625 RepID=F9W937_TRYCI|nr:hypothetical protein, unlikely [Trypanosoma congolense IL3000]
MRNADCLEQGQLKVIQGGVVCGNPRSARKPYGNPHAIMEGQQSAYSGSQALRYQEVKRQWALSRLRGNDNMIRALERVEAWEDKCLRSGERKEECYRHASKSAVLGHAKSVGSGQQVLDTDKALACSMAPGAACHVSMR